MPTSQQIELPGIPAPEQSLAITPMSLMQMSLETGKADQLQILQDMYFKDMARKAEISFNLAMNAVQAEVGRIAPNLTNPQTRSKYASYDKLDAVLRPLYTRHGFSLSFSDEDSPKPEHIRIICYVSHLEGHTRIYRKDMPVVTTGIKGNEMMTPTHATGSADSYAKRYLVKDIFNIAIGEDDNDGNGQAISPIEADRLQEWVDSITGSASFEELEHHFREAYKANTNQTARDAIIYAKNKRKAELRGGK